MDVPMITYMHPSKWVDMVELVVVALFILLLKYGQDQLVVYSLLSVAVQRSGVVERVPEG